MYNNIPVRVRQFVRAASLPNTILTEIIEIYTRHSQDLNGCAHQISDRYMLN